LCGVSRHDARGFGGEARPGPLDLPHLFPPIGVPATVKLIFYTNLPEVVDFRRLAILKKA